MRKHSVRMGKKIKLFVGHEMMEEKHQFSYKLDPFEHFSAKKNIVAIQRALCVPKDT